MHTNRAALYASLLVRISIAMPWLGPMPTPMGLVAMAGVSPRPTEAPGLNGMPRELVKRVLFPPPDNWCGFINGFYDDPLACSVGYTCAYSGQAIGCCTATTGYCSALYTTCVNFLDHCNDSCQRNPAVLSCVASLPYCGTYAFPRGTTNFNCEASLMPIQGVEFLNDYYLTAIGSTLVPDPTINPFDYTPSVSLNYHSATPTNPGAASSTVISSPSQLGSSSGSGSSTTPVPSNSGLSKGAIAGIAAGAAILGLSICSIAAFCCIRARRRKRVAAASNPPPYFQPPMEQQAQTSPPPKAFDGYQSVPQQGQQHTEYPGPHQQAQPFFPPPTSAVSPQSTGASDPRFSTTNASLLSSRPSEPDQKQGYHKPPLSPTITEVDGSTGNPGVPPGVAHGLPTEVDGTMGNPSIPAGGHGIQDQLVPGGSPSATEIEGRMSDAVVQQQQAQAAPQNNFAQGVMAYLINQQQQYSDAVVQQQQQQAQAAPQSNFAQGIMASSINQQQQQQQYPDGPYEIGMGGGNDDDGRPNGWNNAY